MSSHQSNSPVAQPVIASPETNLVQQSISDSNEDNELLRRYSCLYFGYGSNLSPQTMKQRCPGALFVGLGRLIGWRWMINETGYANIVLGGPDDEVWGSLCFLPRRDEMALDESEGVPWLYEKQTLKIRRVPQDLADGKQRTNNVNGDEIDAVAYVDVQRLTEGRIEKDYVVWVNKAIHDAGLYGMPQSYVEKYIQKYLPVKQEGDLPDQDIMMVRTMHFCEPVQRP